MAHPVAEIFLTAARHNRTEEHRAGNVIHFRPGEHMIVAGDVHGNRQNLAKILSYADLGRHPARMLVLQEIIHGGATDDKGGDRSFELLMRAARLRNQFPSQVHFLLGNHDIAQLTDNEITKEGAGVCKGFDLGLLHAFQTDAPEVAAAIDEFILSMPLAGRCPNGVFLSHSLPSPGRAQMFDPEVLTRPYLPEDFHRGHGVYELLWGRHHDADTLNQFASLLGATLFINGHQPVECGYTVNHERQLILSSDHPHGALVDFLAEETLTPDDLPGHVKTIMSL